MTQYINLLNPALRPRHEMLTANLLAATIAVLLVVFASMNFFLKQRADALQAEAKRLSTQSQAEQEVLASAEKAAAASKPDTPLAAEVEAARAGLRMRETAMKALAGGKLGNTDGFSELFRALARQSMNGLWLTGFTLSGSGADMLIQGRTLNAELVPAYLRRLNAEPAFQGRSFASLTIEQGAAAPVSGAKGASGGEGTERPAPFLEFKMMAATEQAAPGKSADAPALRGLVGSKP